MALHASESSRFEITFHKDFITLSVFPCFSIQRKLSGKKNNIAFMTKASCYKRSAHGNQFSYIVYVEVHSTPVCIVYLPVTFINPLRFFLRFVPFISASITRYAYNHRRFAKRLSSIYIARTF